MSHDVRGSIHVGDSVDFNTDRTASPSYLAGRLFWDIDHQTLSCHLGQTDVTLQIGQEQHVRVVNKTGTLISDGSVCYINGAQGNRPTIELADADLSTADQTIGIVTADIADNAEGYLTTFGAVNGINTSGFSAGDVLYLSQTAGQLTKTAPTHPKHVVRVGYALNSTNNGTVFVSIHAPSEIDDLHNVLISTPADKQILRYEASTGLWKNVTNNLSDLADTAISSPTNGQVLSYNSTTSKWVNTTGGGGTSDHTALSNLTTGDAGHTQFALLAGRAGGQTLKGGTAASESLTLSSTANATKGKINLGSSAYDEVNNRLGVGNSSPTSTLHVTGTARVTSTSQFDDSVTVGSNGVFLDATNSRIGVKTTSPSAPLEVRGTKQLAGALPYTVVIHDTTSQGANTGAGIVFTGTYINNDPTTLNYGGLVARKENSVSANTATYLAFYSRPTAQTPVEVGRFTSTGELQVKTAGLVLPKTSGVGIKVDPAAPTFGWKDLIGSITTKGTGNTNPNWAVYRGGIYGYQFTVNDECWLEFHVPHDYVPGTDIHIHAHWSHNSTAVTSGAVTWAFETTYAKGHNQAAFIAPVTPTIAQNAPTTQYQHMIAEVQLSAASPSATQIDSDDIEVDGLILVRCYLSANTMNGTPAPEPFLHFVDIHYQSTQTATKNKAPNFYT